MANRTLPPQAYLRECFDYEPFTGLLRWKNRPRHHFPTENSCSSWNSQNAGNYLKSIDGRYRAAIDGQRYRSNRIIWKWMTGEEPVATIDHKNGNSMDDRWENLRPATKQQNCQNQRGWKNRDLPKGVYKTKQEGRWMATLRVEGKYIYLGYFKSVTEAHAAYCDAATKHYGQFANFGRNHQ